jgi:hypothetical protein
MELDSKADAEAQLASKGKIVKKISILDYADQLGKVFYRIEIQFKDPDSSGNSPVQASSVLHIKKRFKQFVQLDEDLRSAVGMMNSSSLPKLPEKRAKISTDHHDTAFILYRQHQLEQYLDEVVFNEKTHDLPVLREFLTSDLVRSQPNQ